MKNEYVLTIDLEDNATRRKFLDIDLYLKDSRWSRLVADHYIDYSLTRVAKLISILRGIRYD